jgi:hypothetical protein
MRRYLLVLLLLACSAVAHAQEKMLYVEYRVISPNLPPASAENQVRKLWLLGNKYMRFEDVPNPDTKVHGLIIVAEPDIWFIDRRTNRGRHSVDPGPNYAVRFPMLATESSPRLRELEFGSEMAFFEAYGAKERPSQVVDGVSCRVFGMTLDNYELLLFVRKDGKPMQVTVKADAVEYSVRILKYDPDLEPDLKLFKIPATVRME